LSRRTILLLAAGVFLAVLALVNGDLFTRPIVAYFDYAANAIQVRRAMRFRELLGNYSRWGFHHPGPAIFYVWAFGEALFRKRLHIAPAAMNAHILTMTVVNVAFLFTAIGILARRAKSSAFVPAATGLSLVFIYVVNRTIPGSAVLSIWMPHVVMFPFLLYLAACASVASGELRDIPASVFSGAMLIHIHVAQVFFVPLLGAAAAVSLLVRERRRLRNPEWMRQARWILVISVVIASLFAWPILKDYVHHSPNNIDAIQQYLSTYGDFRNPLRSALVYEASFALFLGNIDQRMDTPFSALLKLASGRPYVVVYWCVSLLVLGAAAVVVLRSRQRASALVVSMVAEAVLVAALFCYWSLRLTGPFYNFNGFFFFSVQLFVLWSAALAILERVDVSGPAVLVSACIVPLLVFAAADAFRNVETGDEETNRLTATLPTMSGTLRFTFAREDWLTAVGLANFVKDRGGSFCVDPEWAFTFGADNVCRQSAATVALSRTPHACSEPCVVLSQDPQFTLQLEPRPTVARQP